MNISKASGLTIIRAADKGVLAACVGAIVAVYILDALFFAAWAPNKWLVAVFILIGVVIRTIAVSAGVALQWVRHQTDIKLARGTIRMIWIACLIACLVPAMSFFAGGHKAQTQGKDVSAATTEQITDSGDRRIERLEAQIEDVKETRDSLIANARASMDIALTDGDNRNDDVTAYENNIATYNREAQEKIDEIYARIDAIDVRTEGVQVETAERQTEVSVFFAIFAVIEDVTGLNGENVAIGTLFFFALLIEIIAAFGLGAYYDIHRIFVRLIHETEIKEKEHEEKLSTTPEPQNENEESEEAEDENILTDAQLNGRKGFLAKEAYKEARERTAIPVKPVSIFDNLERQAAE